MTQHTISRIAVVILGIVLFIFGIYHFLNPQNLVVYVPDFIPGGKIWVFLVGAAFILAAIAFILHKQVKLAGYLLALLLIIFVVTIHLPNWLHAGDVDESSKAFVSLLKDTALAAFAMYIASNSQNFDRNN